MSAGPIRDVLAATRTLLAEREARAFHDAADRRVDRESRARAPADR